MNKYVNILNGNIYFKDISYLNNLNNIYEIDDFNLSLFYKYEGIGSFSINENNQAIFLPNIEQFNIKQNEIEMEQKLEKENEQEFLKKQIPYKKLNNSDYKVIKCMETLLLNLPEDLSSSIEFPYDIKSLHAERQAYRDTINNQ